MADEQTVRIFIETPSGERFEADVPCGARISEVAADFFESQGWPTNDRRGRDQRAVVDLVDPENPDNTKRLNSDSGVYESGLGNGGILRISPESLAGAVDYHARLVALTMDHNEMKNLSEQNPLIGFAVNRTQAPDLYNLKLRYTSFVELMSNDKPRKAGLHCVEIMLGAEYPRRAPIVTWQTPIFHPNIRQPNGTVCLGVLQDRFLPGIGLARLVRMLIDMVQWRNFDAYNAFNPEAARWARTVENWPIIEAIGGYPLQGSIEEYIKQLDRATRTPIVFRRLSPDQ